MNLRDLGGIRSADGVVQHGVAIRADDLSLVRPSDADALLQAGLGAVIDLRTAAEVRNTGRGVLAELPASYHHLPLLSALGVRGEASRVDPRDPVAMGGLYTAIWTGAAHHLVTALAVIAYTPGATAFHCAAGKDRTGVLAAAVLLCLGVPDEAVVEDYAATGHHAVALRARLQPVLAPVLAEHGIDGAMSRSAALPEFSTVPMETMLATLRRRHGDPLAPLRDAGLGDQLLDVLRRRALRPGA